MTAIASPAPLTLPRLNVRVTAIIAALCILLGAGIAAAWALKAPAGAPTQSQQPALTSPTPN
jgi:hypothetical protein